MRLQIYWTCLAILLSTPIFAAGNLKDLQGEWARENSISFRIKSYKFEEFAANNPNKPTRTGTIKFSPRGPHADVTFNDKVGDWLRIYSAGQDVLAVQSLNKNEAFIDDGTIYYRHGAKPQVDWSPVGTWELPPAGPKIGLQVTFHEDGTGKANWHDETVLWTQDDTGIVRTIYAHLHRKILKLKLNENGREMHDVDNPKIIWKRVGGPKVGGPKPR